MAVTPRHYETILSPLITEKATLLSEQNKVVFKVAHGLDQGRDRQRDRGAVQGPGRQGQHPDPKGQDQAFSWPSWTPHRRRKRRSSPSKRANPSTLRRGSKRWLLRTFNPTSPSRRELVLVDRSDLHKGRPEKSLVEGLTKSGGRGGGGRVAVRFPRRRRQAPLSHRRLQAPQIRCHRHGRAPGVRPQSHGLHRPDQSMPTAS